MKMISTVGCINCYKSNTVNPMNSPDTVYELYSVPSYDSEYPEILKGSEIGSSKIIVEENDILICKINPRINRVWVVKHNTDYPLLASSEWIVVRSPKNNPDYLKWYFRSPFFQRLMVSQVAGIGGSLTRAQPKQVATYPVPLVSSDYQAKIAELLDRVDRFIQIRRQQLQKLDELVKARFVEMFGDPCNNPMGHIKMTVKDAVDVGYIERPLDGNHGEKHPKVSEYVDDGVPFIMANNIVNGLVDYDNCSKITRERADKLDKGFSHDGDVLITHKGTIGRTAIVHTKLDYIILTPQVTYYRPLKGIISEYLKGYFDTDFFQGEMKKLAAAGGSTRAYVGITNQTQLQFVIPSLDLQTQYAEFVDQVDKSKLSIQASLDQLETLKQSLMQKYFG